MRARASTSSFVHCDDCELQQRDDLTLFFLYLNLNIIMLLFHERYYKITCLQLYVLYGYTFCVTWAKMGII